MKLRIISFTLIALCVGSLAAAKTITIKPESKEMYDSARDRKVPVELYVSDEAKRSARSGKGKLPVVVISPGYGIGKTEYSFIANALAVEGYFVVSIQHDLKDDPALPRQGNITEQRMPFWERGVENILFVKDALHQKAPNLDMDKVILLGHSNGGDISMLFATKRPEMVKGIISFDSLRMALPSSGVFPILYLSANDTKADKGVLPAKAEQKKLHIELIKLKDVKHNDMCDRGSDLVKQEIIEKVLKFLKRY